MKPSEARKFAEQAIKHKERVDEFRQAARDARDRDREQARLLETAADAIESTATEWATLATELAQG